MSEVDSNSDVPELQIAQAKLGDLVMRADAIIYYFQRAAEPGEEPPEAMWVSDDHDATFTLNQTLQYGHDWYHLEVEPASGFLPKVTYCFSPDETIITSEFEANINGDDPDYQDVDASISYDQWLYRERKLFKYLHSIPLFSAEHLPLADGWQEMFQTLMVQLASQDEEAVRYLRTNYAKPAVAQDKRRRLLAKLSSCYDITPEQAEAALSRASPGTPKRENDGQ